jgi:hypothetical protein
MQPQYCTKLTQRNRVCGRELLPNTKCPGGYFHAEAPRYPRVWPAIAVLGVAGLVLLAVGYGVFSFLGPFADYNAASVGSTALTSGARLELGAGATQGLYDVGACTEVGHDPALVLATLVGGGRTITVRASAVQPYFSESPLLYAYASVRQCATFTAPVTATYVVTTSVIPSSYGVIPSSALWRVTLYHLLGWLSIALVVGATIYLSLMLRRRSVARDPTEHADLSADPIARAALVTESFLASQEQAAARPTPDPRTGTTT